MFSAASRSCQAQNTGGRSAGDWRERRPCRGATPCACSSWLEQRNFHGSRAVYFCITLGQCAAQKVDIDALIIGCWSGTGDRRGGMMSQFLLALLERPYDGPTAEPATYMSFCKCAAPRGGARAGLRERRSACVLQAALAAGRSQGVWREAPADACAP